MIIHPIEKKIADGVLELSASIQWEHNGVGYKNSTWFTPPERLWYRLDEKYADTLSDNHNAFLGSLLVMAMFFKEDVHVKGNISGQLLYNLREYQRTLHFWRPDWFSVVNVTCDTIVSGTTNFAVSGSMCSYSGGIDSSHTLWTHLPKNEPLTDFQVTHALHIPGFDTDGESLETQKLKIDTYTKGLEAEGVALVVVWSNTRAFHQFDFGEEKGYFAWGSNVAGTSLLFENLVNRFYFSADNQHDDPIALTINHTLLPLLSTDNLKVVLDGGTISKYEKISDIAQWESTYDKLMVCYKSPDGLHNCDTCVKCIRTTAVLETLGVLDRYTTFPSITNPKGMRLSLYPREFVYCMKKPRNFFFRNGEYGYALNYQCAIFLSWVNVYYYDVTKFFEWIYISPIQLLFKLSHVLKRRLPLYDKLLLLIK